MVRRRRLVVVDGHAADDVAAEPSQVVEAEARRAALRAPEPRQHLLPQLCSPHYFLQGDFGAGKEKKGECPFCILEKRIARSLSSEAVSDAPLKINSCLRIYAEHFRTGRQEDAHEFLRYVIDACHNTCLRLKKLQQQQRGKSGIANVGDISGTGETVVKEIFGGALQSQVKCLSCGAESNKVDEIMDISLDILQSGSLKEALQKFFQPEVLDGNNKYKCDHCKEMVAARKQMSVLEAPNVLVIQLKRFEGMFGGKVDKPIAFDEILVLSSHMCKGSQDQHPEYNLFGTIVHSGFSPDSGHYYAYIKDAVGRWYCCNDSYVSVSTLQEVLSEKVYILFFSRTKQRPRTRVDVVANGSKTHESNGSKTSVIQKSGCLDKPVTRQVANHQPGTNNSTNGIKSFIHKSGCLEKPVNMKISANHSEINNSTNYLTSNGTKAPIIQRSDHLETPGSTKQLSDDHSEMYNSIVALGSNSGNSTGVQNSGAFVEPMAIKESSNHHSQMGNSTISKVDQGVSSQNRKFSNSGNANKLLAPGNIKIAVYSKESREKNGHTAASVDSVEKEKTGLPINERNGMSKKSSDVQIMKRGLTSSGISNGENGPSAVNSFERSSDRVNGFNTSAQNSLNRQDLQNGGIMSSSNHSCMKRKIEDGHSCIFLARDDQSRAKIEAFKNYSKGFAVVAINKCSLLSYKKSITHVCLHMPQDWEEASAVLSSCGWSDEVHSFMHERKKLCQEAGNGASNDLEMK
ncbi:UNVERIFIED_CONTAM: Ubiquitin carboxyl-terminal hydrolase 25 [Sesamum radiatum]|uniref:ubiquitinyl hydrolase 1 n=1 Tax=Sesamum radiatum TaxID=300843 RepID=A0AAW2T3R1_SESRA